MNTMTKSLLFGASLLTLSGAAFAADQRPQRTWVQPPAWVMLLDRGDQIVTISPERAAYINQAIAPDNDTNVAEAK